MGFYTSFQQTQDSSEGTSGGGQFHEAEPQTPVTNTESYQQEEALEENDTEPFFFYQYEHVQDSINQCKNNILGKILSDKPISTQTLRNTLFGIWYKPQGFQLSEIEGKLLQIKMDKEEDIQRIIKGSPWIIRNCWLVVHYWNRALDISNLDFTNNHLWIKFWGLL